MRSKLLLTMMLLAGLVVLAIPMAPPVLAQQVSSLVQTLSTDVSVTYSNGTVQYSIIVTNQNLEHAVPVNFDLYFSPPGPTGAIGAYGPEVKLNTAILHYAVGETHTYTSATVIPAGNWSVLAVTLSDIPLNPGVTVAYAQSRFHATYEATPPYTADDSRNIPVQIIWSSTTVTIVSDPVGPVAPGSTVTLTVTESNPIDGVALTSPRVELTGGLILTLDHSSGYFVALSDPVNSGVLDPGETWQWTGIPSGALTSTTTFTATGHGFDSDDTDITSPAFPSELANVTVTVSSPPKHPPTIPTMGQWGMIAMATLLAGSLVWVVRKRQTSSGSPKAK